VKTLRHTHTNLRMHSDSRTHFGESAHGKIFTTSFFENGEHVWGAHKKKKYYFFCNLCMKKIKHSNQCAFFFPISNWYTKSIAWFAWCAKILLFSPISLPAYGVYFYFCIFNIHLCEIVCGERRVRLFLCAELTLLNISIKYTKVKYIFLFLRLL